MWTRLERGTASNGGGPPGTGRPAGLGPKSCTPTLLALGSRAAFRIPQPLVQTITTNVPGPRFPLFLLGRQMVATYPYVPIGNGLRIGIAIFSYLNRLSFGITADYDSVSDGDLDVLIAGIARGLADLAGSAAGEGTSL